MPTIPWNELAHLRVVRSVRSMLARRWGLGMAFVTPRGEIWPTDDGDASAWYRASCPGLAHDEAACQRDGHKLWSELSSTGYDQGATGLATCHAGLRQAGAAVVMGGQPAGAVVCGGYRVEGADPTAASGGHRPPLLDEGEERSLCDMLGLVAQEVSDFAGRAARLPATADPDELERPTRYSYDEIIGESRPMKELYHLMDKVIDSESTVMIQGENGTGKELIARAIHFNSRRRHRRFVVQNCSAFNDNLLDSELFGHRKGAFTGAISDRPGLFEAADGSTFFLDEIGDMSAALQVKLLRVLQEGTFIPVGGTQPKQVDVRIIAATNRNLKKMVEQAEFREDLYYRVNVINILIPPLRRRKEDIPLLVEHFLAKHSRHNGKLAKRILKSAVVRLMEYNWPGNIRELENEIERMVVLAGKEPLIGEELLSSRVRHQTSRSGPDREHNPHCLPEAIENLERSMITEVLRQNRWNKTRAARQLQISRRNLIRKVAKYKLEERKN